MLANIVPGGLRLREGGRKERRGCVVLNVLKEHDTLEKRCLYETHHSAQ